ncbi:uncharacterized protein LOC132756459 isoform X2 [Ruditapes philippinarum]|nr:uncharacterized protein LOC132756459 isoform X2 [Ruditapes philippinarum]
MDGYTPLHLAATNGDLVMYKLLKESGCNPFIENVNGETPSRILEIFYESVQETGNNVQQTREADAKEQCSQGTGTIEQQTMNNVQETEQHSEVKVNKQVERQEIRYNKQQATNKAQEAENKAQVEYEEQKNGEIKQKNPNKVQEAGSYVKKNGKKSKRTRRKGQHVKNKIEQSGNNIQPTRGMAQNIANMINPSDHECVGFDKKGDGAMKKGSKRSETAFVARNGKCRKKDEDATIPDISVKQGKKKANETFFGSDSKSVPDVQFWLGRFAYVSVEDTCRQNSSPLLHGEKQKNDSLRTDLKRHPEFRKVSATVSSADDALASGISVDEENCGIKTDCKDADPLPDFKVLYYEKKDNTQEENTENLNESTRTGILEYLRRQREQPRKIARKGFKSSKNMKKASNRDNTAFVAQNGKYREKDQEVTILDISVKQGKKEANETFVDTDSRSVPDVEFRSMCFAHVSVSDTSRENLSTVFYKEEHDNTLKTEMKKNPEFRKVSATNVSSADDALASGMSVDEKIEIKTDCKEADPLPDFKVLFDE